MENIVFDRNYELTSEDNGHADAVYEKAIEPDGFFASFGKKMDAIPKIIVPEDQANYEYLLERCDQFAQDHHGRIHAVVDYQRFHSEINLYLRMIEFDCEEDMSLLKDIGERAHYVCNRCGKLFADTNGAAELSRQDLVLKAEYILGDADSDGSVTILDATFIQRALVGIELYPHDFTASVKLEKDGDSVKAVASSSFGEEPVQYCYRIESGVYASSVYGDDFGDFYLDDVNPEPGDFQITTGYIADEAVELPLTSLTYNDVMKLTVTALDASGNKTHVSLDFRNVY